MFNGLWESIKKLFNRATQQSQKEIDQGQNDARSYYDISHENITAIVANALAILAFGDSTVEIDTGGTTTKRSELLNKVAQKEFTAAKIKIIAALGVGMVASIPYSVDNGLGRRVYIDTITKDRFIITGSQGDDITEITALSDVAEVNRIRYYRWTDYSVQGGIYSIRNKATTESGVEVPMQNIPKWANIAPEIQIAGVDRLPVAFYSCPAGGRRPSQLEGVPITYGCKATLTKIANTLDKIEREFDKKDAKVFASRALLQPKKDEKGNVVGNSFDDDLFVGMADTNNADDITIFDPAIRDSAYYNKLVNHFAFLEKEIGCSKGVLTDLVTGAATATEIKRSMYATFSLTDDMRKEYANYFDTLIYSVNVLCNFYNITPPSDYTIKHDWGYGLLEDSEQTFNQLERGKADGVIKKVELRQFLKPDETPEEAQAAIDEIKADEPPLQSLMGD